MAVCHDAQACAHPRGARRHHHSLGRGDAFPAYAPGSARRRIPANESDHAARLRPHLRGLRARCQRPAAGRGVRPRRNHSQTEAGLHQLLLRREGAPAVRRGVNRPAHPQSGRQRLARRGDAQDRPEQPRHDHAHRPHTDDRRRRKGVRPRHLRHRSDRPERRHLGQALFRPARVPGHHHRALPGAPRSRLPLTPCPADRSGRLRTECPRHPGRCHLRVPTRTSRRAVRHRAVRDPS